MTPRRLPNRRDVGRVMQAKRHVFGYLAAAVMLALVATQFGDATAQGQQHAGHALGKVEFPVSCSAQAQEEFNRAVALLHHMTYPQAREAFRHAATTDPQCAMAHWGIAMTLFQPLWPTRPQPEALRQGWEAVQTAKGLQPPTQREQGFVAAAEAFFSQPTSPDYWLRIRRWEQAMEKLYISFPDDPETAAFYALAHLATAPANTLSHAHSDRAAEILLRVYQRNPDHPGAMHDLVHANDTPGRERESLEITRKYEATAPHNPHALHMPTHIYTRLGDWKAVIQGNLRAAEAARAAAARSGREAAGGEFPHAIEYRICANLQKGEDENAAAQLARLHTTARLEPTFKTAFHLMSTQARYALERRAWSEAASLVPRQPPTLDWDRYAWPEAIAIFARGLGAAHLGKANEASADAAHLEELEAATRKAGEDLFARNIRVLRLELSAWLAHIRRQSESGVLLMREAAELEASTPKHAVTPGPTLPAEELLGDLLTEQGQPAAALAAYKQSLERYPKRFNSLLGAARAAHLLGDESSARMFCDELLEALDGETRRLTEKPAEADCALARWRSATSRENAILAANVRADSTRPLERAQ